jgi:hypothetical protein
MIVTWKIGTPVEMMLAYGMNVYVDIRHQWCQNRKSNSTIEFDMYGTLGASIANKKWGGVHTMAFRSLAWDQRSVWNESLVNFLDNCYLHQSKSGFVYRAVGSERLAGQTLWSFERSIVKSREKYPEWNGNRILCAFFQIRGERVTFKIQ